jgi:hypothetical protein
MSYLQWAWRLKVRSLRIHFLLYNSKWVAFLLYILYYVLNILSKRKNILGRVTGCTRHRSSNERKKEGKILCNGCSRDIRFKFLSCLLLNKIYMILIANTYLLPNKSVSTIFVKILSLHSITLYPSDSAIQLALTQSQYIEDFSSIKLFLHYVLWKSRGDS